MTQLAHIEHPPMPITAAPRPTATDDQLLDWWLHGRSPHPQLAYRADSERFRVFVAKPLAMDTLGDLQAFRGMFPGTLAP
jgi:hypothetical protein